MVLTRMGLNTKVLFRTTNIGDWDGLRGATATERAG